MISSQPLVSIIINCFNGEIFLKDCLKSVLNQTYKNWEVIFWDNKSTDKSAKIFKNYKNKKFRYFFSKKHSTLYEARNKAIKKARGKYVSFLDTDDLWNKNKLKTQVNFLEKNKNYNIVYSNFFVLKEKNKLLNKFYDGLLPHGNITQNLLNNYCIGILTVLIKRKIFNKYKFNKTYTIIGDFDFFLKFSCKNKIAVIQKPLAKYRSHAKNISKIKINLYIKELKLWLKKNKFFYKNYSLSYIRFNLIKLYVKLIISKLLNVKLGA